MDATSRVSAPGERRSVGRITKRAAGDGPRYEVRIKIQGRQESKTFRRRADADAYLRQRLVDDMTGVAIAPKLGKVSFAEYSAQWMANGGTRGRLAPRTREYYGDLLRLHILPTFGSAAISAIRNEDVRAWLAGLSVDRPLQAAKAYRLLSTIMATAVTDRRITVNPCNIRGAGVEAATERPLISPRDAHDLADTIAPEFRCLVLLAEFAQLRLGELLGLTVADVNLADRTVRVERQALEIGGQGRVVTEPKSAAGRRTVSVPDGLVVELAEHIDAHCSGGGDGWLFANPQGHPYWRWQWARAWTEARAAVNASRADEGLAGLPEGLHLHDLRHSGLTYVAHGQVTTKELMRRGGHASPTAALRYQHEAEGRDREIADALGVLFDAPRDRGATVKQIRPRDIRVMSGAPARSARASNGV